MAPHKIWTRGEKGPHFRPYLAYPGYFTLFVSRAGGIFKPRGCTSRISRCPCNNSIFSLKTQWRVNSLKTQRGGGGGL